jgi:large subunit ribosomal protein L19
MANTITYNEQKYAVGDTIAVDYKIKDGEKFRIQQFAGILLKVKGDTENNRMVTVRKVSKAGIGVERIFPLASPFIDAISLVKKTSNKRAKVYYVRDLSDKKLRRKLYHKANDYKRAQAIKRSAPKAKTEDAPAEEAAE